QIATFALRQKPDKGAPCLGKDRARAIEEPIDLGAPAQKDAAQDQPADPVGMRFGVVQCECRAPRSAEQQPLVDAELPAQQLDIAGEMIGRVVLDLAERRRAAGAALVENDDPPMRRVEEPAMHRRRAGARTAMQEQQRSAARVARLLPIHRMPHIKPEAARAVWFDRREEVAAAIHSLLTLEGPWRLR